jgi:hypothetical protein
MTSGTKTFAVFFHGQKPYDGEYIYAQGTCLHNSVSSCYSEILKVKIWAHTDSQCQSYLQ